MGNWLVRLLGGLAGDDGVQRHPTADADVGPNADAHACPFGHTFAYAYGHLAY